MSSKYLFAIICILTVCVVFLVFINIKNLKISDKDLITGSIDSGISPVSSTSSKVTRKERNIIVDLPKPGEKLGSPFIIKGKAKVFENRLTIILREDNKEAELYKESVIVDALDINQFGNFEIKIPAPISAAGKKLILEVFNYSNEDRSAQNLVAIPVEVTASETMDIEAYFINNKLDLENTCVKVFPNKRQILKTQEVAYMSLYQLIQGPNIGELSEGYDTGIPGNVRINSVTIHDGTVFVDFDEGLEYGVAGSCRVAAIRSQIEATLKQFPNIKNIVISINGRTEEILIPSPTNLF